MEFNRIIINPKSVARFLGTIAFLLALISIGTQTAFYITGNPTYNRGMFNVDVEYNVPNMFSAFLFFFSAILLAMIAFLKRKQAEADVLYWVILSFGFFYMAVDDALEIHERISDVLKKMIGNQSLGVFYYPWIIPGIAIIVILGLFFLRFFFRLHVKTRINFFISAALFIGGAIGVEAIGGYYAEHHGENSLTYSAITTIEESLEMAGIISFIWSLFVYISEKYKEVRFQIREGEGDGEVEISHRFLRGP